MFRNHFRNHQGHRHFQEWEAQDQQHGEQHGPREHGRGWHQRDDVERRRAFWFGPGGPRGRGPGWERGGRGEHGGGPFDEDGGRRRQRRGDIKFALLELIAEQPRHGYELIKELEQRYGGFYRPSPGSVYPTLQLLEEEGHLSSETADGKKVYTITESGRALLAERQQSEQHGRGRAHGMRGRGGSPELHKLRESGQALATSTMQVARHGTPEQIAAVTKLLNNARRQVYAVLAQDEADNVDEVL